MKSRRGSDMEESTEEGHMLVLSMSTMDGSVLDTRVWRRSSPKFNLCAWVHILLADLRLKKYLWSLYNTDIDLACPCSSDGSSIRRSATSSGRRRPWWWSPARCGRAV